MATQVDARAHGRMCGNCINCLVVMACSRHSWHTITRSHRTHRTPTRCMPMPCHVPVPPVLSSFTHIRSQTNAVDLGQVMSSGAKKMWRKVRRSSNASVTSNASVQSSASVPANGARGRSDSTSSNPASGVTGRPSLPPQVDGIDEAEEEEEEPQVPSSPKLTASNLAALGDGDATPGRRRSPSPPGEDYVDAPEVHAAEDDAYHPHRSSTAALGFDLRDYKTRPTWGRRGSGSGTCTPERPSSPAVRPAVNVQQHPRVV